MNRAISRTNTKRWALMAFILGLVAWLTVAAFLAPARAESPTLGTQKTLWPSSPEKVLTLKKSQDYYSLLSYREVLEDPAGELTFYDIAHNPRQHNFRPLAQGEQNVGYTDSVYWLRIPVRNGHPNRRKWFVEHPSVWLAKVDLFVVKPNESFVLEHKISGTDYPLKVREVRHSRNIFLLNLTYKQKIWVYVRLKSRGMQLNMAVWTPESFLEHERKAQFAHGMYYGLILIMAVYNFFVYFLVRDRSYIYYSVYIMLVALFQAAINGYGYEYLWPDLVPIGIEINNAISAVVVLMAIRFSINFLQLRSQSQRFYQVLFWSQLLPLSGLALFFWPSFRQSYLCPALNASIGAVVIVLIIMAALRVYLRGYKPARFFLIGWSILTVSVFAFVFKQFGLLPSSFITDYAVYLGTIFEVSFLAFALGDRINYWKEERDRAQEQLLKAQRELTDKLEEKVVQRTAELEKSERRFRVLSEATFEGIMISSYDYAILDCNPALEKLSGFDRSEIIGKQHIMFVHPDYKEIAERNISLRHEKPYEIEIKSKNGEYIPVEVLGKNFPYEGRDVRITALRDIRERKRIERMKEDVQRIIRHDMKNPLSSILGFADLLEQPTSEDKRKKYLKYIQQSVKKILSLIDSQLDFFRIEEGTYRLQPHKLDLLPFLHRSWAELERSWRRRLVSLNLELDGSEWRGQGSCILWAEEDKLSILFGNLIRNAIEASPRQGLVSIKVFCSGREQTIIEIHNDGVIPENIRQLFFDPYVTYGKATGTGLGTYSALLIARAHGGEIRYTTSEQEGTSLFVSLPQNSAL